MAAGNEPPRDVDLEKMRAAWASPPLTVAISAGEELDRLRHEQMKQGIGPPPNGETVPSAIYRILTNALAGAGYGFSVTRKEVGGASSVLTGQVGIPLATFCGSGDTPTLTMLGYTLAAMSRRAGEPFPPQGGTGGILPKPSPTPDALAYAALAEAMVKSGAVTDVWIDRSPRVGAECTLHTTGQLHTAMRHEGESDLALLVRAVGVMTRDKILEAADATRAIAKIVPACRIDARGGYWSILGTVPPNGAKGVTPAFQILPAGTKVEPWLSAAPPAPDRVTVTETMGDYTRTVEGSLDNPDVRAYWDSLAKAEPMKPDGISKAQWEAMKTRVGPVKAEPSDDERRQRNFERNALAFLKMLSSKSPSSWCVIVPAVNCLQEEIEAAKAVGRLFVDAEGYGYVIRPTRS